MEHGSARTWAQGCATRETIAAEAEFLTELAERLPAALWAPGVTGAG